MNRLEEQGQFAKAAGGLSQALHQVSLTGQDRKALEFELDRLERIKQDFPLTREGLYAELKRSVKDLTPEEYERWISEARFDFRDIDGQRFYMAASLSNLFFRHPELEPRRVPRKDTTALQKAVLQSVRAIK